MPQLLKKPMSSKCLVSVLIPVYNEDLKTILTVLASLARQKYVTTEMFEVVLIVSNSKQEARVKTQAFLQNQRIISYFKKVIENKTPILGDRKISLIKKKQLKINLIDNSSFKFAKIYENANNARNRAGKEICQRFLNSSAKESGIIALTDCDCEFSSNYIFELIKTFNNNKVVVNRVAGKMFMQVEKGKNKKIMEMASIVHFDHDYLFNLSKIKLKQPLRYFYPQGSKKLYIAGQNIAVTVSAWFKAGGITGQSSFADMLFVKRVDQLSGAVVYNPNFWVCTLFRVSKRAGLVGLGQRVSLISESIENYTAGKSNSIKIPHWPSIYSLATKIILLVKNGQQNVELVREIAYRHGVDWQRISDEVIKTTLNLLHIFIHTNPTVKQVRDLEKNILTYFYNNLPTKEFKDTML